MPELSGGSIVLEESAVETAACDAKPAFAGWGILVREGGLRNMSDDFNRAVFDRAKLDRVHRN